MNEIYYSKKVKLRTGKKTIKNVENVIFITNVDYTNLTEDDINNICNMIKLKINDLKNKQILTEHFGGDII
jgi:hypothetical protein